MRDAGLDVAPLTHNRSPQIRTPAPPASVSNQNGRERASNLLPAEHHVESRNEQENT
jgi:hypothetical protein